MANINISGPDAFHRTTLVYQETIDSWPVVYMWDGDADDDKAPIVRWVFRRGNNRASTEQQNCEWDGENASFDDLFKFSYEQWWAFIYWMTTNAEDGEDVVQWEQQFFKQVIQPQTPKEKSNV